MKLTWIPLVAFLTACATVAPTQSYRPANYGGPAWSISAKAESGALKDTVTVTINGQAVTSGTLHELRPKDNFTGAFEGHNVLAECGLVNTGGLMYAHECTVFIDNERAAHLSF